MLVKGAQGNVRIEHQLSAKIPDTILINRGKTEAELVGILSPKLV